ncbi:MAG TPA: methyltransferase domain-containing protein [Candidatus Woesearchaeota archaeon]|nr:methyltransferase domain-containing protein [Candidatus Woesearchaeota archaeon]
MGERKILVKKEKKAYVKDLEREFVLSGFEKHYVETTKDYHTKYGVIKRKDLLRKPGSKLRVGNHEFIILDPVFLDHYKRIRRLAQIITLKDIGAIIANTGLTKDSVVLDAGSGSGALACFLGVLAKKVVTYDINEKSVKITCENVEALGLKNVFVKQGNIYEYKQVKEKNIDVFVLDVPEPWKAIRTAQKVLKIGGFLVVYLPNLNQVQRFVKALPEEFLLEKTVEVVEREWLVDEKRIRPKTKDHAHTGFLTFVRKLREEDKNRGVNKKKLG